MYSKLAYQYIPMSDTHHWYRTRAVSAVVIHHTACIVQESRYVVQAWENSNPYTSSNYIIDVKGRITAVIPEELRPYTSSSWGLGDRDIDDRAITIECSNDDTSDWSLSEETFQALIKLLADIGERYNIHWSYTGDESGNIHAHRWYGATGCPGDWLYARFRMVSVLANEAMKKDDDNNDDGGNDDNMTPEEFYQAWTEAWKEFRKTLQDNDSHEWSQDAREWAIDNGIVLGAGQDADGRDIYSWEDLVTREQMVVFLYRFFKKYI